MENVEIVQRDEAYVVFTREMGNYAKSSDVAWRKLSEQMNSLNEAFTKKPPTIEMNLEAHSSEAIGICHDDPAVAKEEDIRYDAALAWGKAEVDELAKYGFETKNIEGGAYAKTTYIGTDEEAEKAWYGLYAWIESNGHSFRDAPAFEKYLNVWEEQDPHKMITEVYVPIEA